MKASTYIKSHGLPSLAHVSREADIPERTLFDQYRDKFKRVEKMVYGCVLDQKLKEWDMTVEEFIVLGCVSKGTDDEF